MMFGHSPDGVPLSIVYDDLLYYYVTNLQGDVVAILDATGAEVVTYTYDAWGNIRTIGGSKATTLGQDNPLRYRGYVYDTETGLYYLQSRYYDPEMGRFICADTMNILTATLMGLTNKDLFAYCDNNPVVRIDITGYFWKEIWDWAEDIYEQYMEDQQQQRALDTQIRIQQNEMIADGVNTIWNAYQRGYELEQEAIMIQAKANVDMFDSPEDVERSLDIIDATCGFSLAAYEVAYVAVVTGPTVGAVVLGVAGLLWAGRAIYRAVK